MAQCLCAVAAEQYEGGYIMTLCTVGRNVLQIFQQKLLSDM